MIDRTIICSLVALGYETTKAWRVPERQAEMIVKSRCAICRCSMLETRGIGTVVGYRTNRRANTLEGDVFAEVNVDTCLSHYCKARAVELAEATIRAQPESAWTSR